MEYNVLNVICGACLSLALILVLVLIILNLRPFNYKKKIEGQNTCLTIMAKRNIDRVAVQTWIGNDMIDFERKRIRKGQKIDFVFPTPDKKIKLIVEVEAGRQRAFEI
jgi:hypothetical protein